MKKRTPFEAAAAQMRAEIQAASRTTQKRAEDTVLSAQDLIHGAVPDEPLRQAELAARAALAAPLPYRLGRDVQDALVAVARRHPDEVSAELLRMYGVTPTDHEAQTPTDDTNGETQ